MSTTSTWSVTHSQGLPQGQVGEENVCLLHIADLTLHLFVHLLGVERDSTTGESHVTCQSIEEGGLTRP